MLADSLRSYISSRADFYLELLSELISIPSVSAYNKGIDEATRLVSDILILRGFNVDRERAGETRWSMGSSAAGVKL